MTKQQHIEELQDKLRSQIQQAEDTLWHLRKQLSRLNGIAADEPNASVLTDEMAKVLVYLSERKQPDTQTRWDAEIMLTLAFEKDIFALKEIGYCDFDSDDHWQLTDTGRAALKAHQASAETTSPHCACGNTNDLTEVIATPDGTYHLCPKHLAEEREQ